MIRVAVGVNNQTEALTNRELIEQKSNMILHMKAMLGKYVLGVQVMSLDML